MKTTAEPRAGTRLPTLVLAVLGAALALLLAAAPGARAADGLEGVAQDLRQGPVHVDPRAADRLPGPAADAVAGTIERADKPVFVAVLPESAEFDPATLFQDLRTETGITGVYAVALGDRFAARADSSVMSPDEVTNLAGAAERSADGDVEAMVTDFVDQAVQQADGRAPATWDSGADSGAAGDAAATGTGGLAVLVVMFGLLMLVTGGALLSGRRRAQRRAEEQRAQLETLRPVVDEDITAFGERLDRIGFSPSAPGTDDAMREDYTRALDSYDQAKDAMAGARHPSDVRAVTEALEEGRFALATLEARQAGEPLPERRSPCFFDPRHGPSVQDVTWAPPGGTEREVPVCAADAARLAEGEEPMTREVETASGRRPYWEAGPAYGPWAFGYFGGALLPGLLMGTMLGGMLHGPYGYGYGGEYGGGEYAGGAESGSDFDSGDFGGFGGGDAGGFGGFGGGDFGGGF
ncbi:hypothetical protein [Streptomyces sp. JJ36]|uniref:hypothetical protein n=1 Tax=Streptomyces sp. JJ36 TaxID=2736645 RepID=UPI001F1E472F|nr:hypothetical protein [Streptomyces sp. JJ36]MCF6522490.1 hypothetical protein [Streptomyces sp. JJ36]